MGRAVTGQRDRAVGRGRETFGEGDNGLLMKWRSGGGVTHSLSKDNAMEM